MLASMSFRWRRPRALSSTPGPAITVGILSSGVSMVSARGACLRRHSTSSSATPWSMDTPRLAANGGDQNG